MQRVTAWGAALSPDGEYWWDGTSWRPMYTPDRKHIWNGRGWQAAPPAELAPPVAPAGAGIPSWLPRGATPHGLWLSTPAHRLSTTTQPELPVAKRRRSGGRLAAALVGVVAVLIGLAAAAGGYLYYQRATSGRPDLTRPAGLAGMVAQPNDVPVGLHRCPAVNFDQRGYLSYLRRTHPERYESALAGWSKSQAGGLLDAWHVAYAEDPARCDGVLTGQSQDRGTRGLLNVVFLTRDDASAAAAYAESSRSVPSFLAAQKGAATGLGEDSTEAYTDVGTFKSYLAVWRSAAYAALLSADGLNLEEARRAAAAVKARMR